MKKTSLPLDYSIKLSNSKKNKKPCIVLLHGYGSNEKDLFSFSPYFPSEYTIISFRAPIILEMGGYAWSNIYMDDLERKNSVILEAKESLKLIKDSIKLCIVNFNLNEKDISLIGFSQGCMLSWAMIINYPFLIRRAVTLSGYIIPELIEAPLKNVSELLIFSSHGILDQMIPIQKARESFDLVKKNNPNITYKEYNQGHEINQENFSDFLNWLKSTSQLDTEDVR
jgi:phospholipase/carboxylesterase